MDIDNDMTNGDTVFSPGPSSVSGETRLEGVARDHPEIELGDLASSRNSEEEGSDLEQVEEEDYEASRQRRIEENRLLLDSLFVDSDTNAVASSSKPIQIAKPPPTKRRKLRTATYDRSGHIISLPNPGEKHVMACIELPRDRKIMRMITDGDYLDCSDWAEGEERRWRIGDGKNVYQQGEEVIVGGVGPDFRWRKWLGVHRELKNELVKRGEMNEDDVRGTRAAGPVDLDVSEYSLIPGSSCHQCRRKSEKEKMKCRNTQPECNAVFCSSCCKRYSYFEFDPDSRSFICPLCRNICNCSNCIRKRDLAHLLDFNKSGSRKESLALKIRREGTGLTVEEFIQSQEIRVIAPFDRVRLVCQEEDIISPELPPEPVIVPVKAKPANRKAKKSGMANQRAAGPRGLTVKKKKQTKASPNGTKSASPIKLRSKVPAQTAKNPTPLKQVRHKEVDSDGDTVGGWSDDSEDGGARSPESSLTALSDLSVTPPRRLAFPPRPNVPDLETTTTALLKVIDGAMDIDMNMEMDMQKGIDDHGSHQHQHHPGFIRPDMMHQAFHQSTNQDQDKSSPRLVDLPQSQPDEIHYVNGNGEGGSPPRVNKRKKPPPASKIARAPRYMTHPHLTRSPPSSTSSSSSSSTSMSNNGGSSSTTLPSQTTCLNTTETESATNPVRTHSSPDPLMLPIPSYLDTLAVKQSDRRLADVIFLNNPTPPRHESDREDDLESLPDVERDRGRDPLFPDTPLWYAYNSHLHLSPPTRDRGDTGGH